jgi:hypothetical protein
MTRTPDRPRTLEEVRAAQSPSEKARWANAASFKDESIKDAGHAAVWVIQDANHPDNWRVEYQDDDGGCYVTIFSGAAAERSCFRRSGR